MSEKEIPKPWTSIIPLNEEYFLALHEYEHLLKQGKKPLPLSYVRSRKSTWDDSPGNKLPGAKPWEDYFSDTVKVLNYTYNRDLPEHAGFNLQDQARRDSRRNLHAVFLDYVELELPIFSDKTSYRIGYKLRRIPKDSESIYDIRSLITVYERDHGLYPNTSKQAKKLYRRIESNPSCLEICGIKSTSPSKLLIPYSVTERYLDGKTKRARNFMMQLDYLTGGFLVLADKRYDKRTKGLVLDGLVRKLAIPERVPA